MKVEVMFEGVREDKEYKRLIKYLKKNDFHYKECYDKEQYIANNYKEIIVTVDDIVKHPKEYYGKTVKGYTCQNDKYVSGWQLFHVDENGTIYLIASDYIPVEACPKSKNDNSLYKNSEYCASFQTIIKDYDGSKDTLKAVSYMLDTQAWSGFCGENAAYAIGGPSIELLRKSYNACGYKYAIKSTEKALAYWLASGAMDNNDDSIYVYYVDSIFSASCSNVKIGFRPVACVKKALFLNKDNYLIII